MRRATEMCSLPTLWRCSDLDWQVPCQLYGDALTWTDMFLHNGESTQRATQTCSLPVYDLNLDWTHWISTMVMAVDNFDCDWTTFYARAMNGFDCGWTAFLPMAEAVDGFGCDWATFPAMAKAVNGFVTEPLSIQQLWIALTVTEPHSHQWQRL